MLTFYPFGVCMRNFTKFILYCYFFIRSLDTYQTKYYRIYNWKFQNHECEMLNENFGPYQYLSYPLIRIS